MATFKSGRRLTRSRPIDVNDMKPNHDIAFILRFLVLLILISAGSAPLASAFHLVGGELTYECQTNNNYLVKLKIFRDCYCTNCADFDNPAYVFVYDDAGNMVSQLSIPFPGSVQLPVYVNNPCLAVPPDVCVEEAVYTALINLPPISGGYHMVHQRCCRNSTILNISAPNTFGATYYAHVPDPAIGLCSSNPYFNNFPPIALCVGDTLSFDHSATDIDGDSLVYELCTPYSGASQGNPQPNLGSPPPPPPYGFVNFVPPYSAQAPFNGAPQMNIDPQTGLLTGSPTTVGQFVVGVCVQEYRNGLLLSTNKRDFQFNVVQCDAVITASMPSYVLECDDYTVNFINNSSGGTFYEWDFGDGGTSTSASPTHTYVDTGVYYATLIANPGWPCADTAYSTVDVYPGMTANYSYITHCADSDITFTDLSVSFNGLITDWAWNFGDGGTSTDQNAIHNYVQGGLYNVVLSTTNDKGCIDFMVQQVYVFLEPEPTVLFNEPCEKTMMTFQDGTQLDSGYVVSWDWDIAGLATDSVYMTSYTFDTSGFYDITLAVVTEHGCDGITTQTIFVKPIPASDAGLDTSICPGDMITIGGAITSGYTYDWDPPTGLNSPLVASPTLVLGNDSNVLMTHEYIVTTSLNGCSSSDTVNIAVFPSISPTLPDQPEQCLPDNNFFFEAGGVYGTSAVFNWNFGDGNGGPGGDTLSHSYLDTGTYTVTVTIEDNGCTETATTVLTVYDVPVASFSIDKSVGCSPFEVFFYATSSDPEIADSQYIFIWDFDDGSPLDSSQNTVHTYTNDSIYQPSLTIILGTCAGFEQMTQSITVEALPTPTAGILLDPPIASLYDPIVTILDISQGADSCYLVLSSGDTIDACNYIQNYFDPNAPYNETTTHYITQYVMNDEGCRDSILVSIDILPEYIFFAPSSFTPNGDGINDMFFGKGFGIKKFEMFIYNRWGDLIWETRDQYEGWSGYANDGDREAQQGVYVYLVSIVDIYDVTHKVVGKVVLIR